MYVERTVARSPVLLLIAIDLFPILSGLDFFCLVFGLGSWSWVLRFGYFTCVKPGFTRLVTGPFFHGQNFKVQGFWRVWLSTLKNLIGFRHSSAH